MARSTPGELLRLESVRARLADRQGLHRSAGLVPPVIAHFANRELHSNTSVASSGDPDELLNFQVTHVDKPTADFRCLTEALDTRPDSYLRKQVDLPDVDLDGRVFSTFAARPSGVKVLPKKTVSVGFSAMSLHWPATDRKCVVPLLIHSLRSC